MLPKQPCFQDGRVLAQGPDGISEHMSGMPKTHIIPGQTLERQELSQIILRHFFVSGFPDSSHVACSCEGGGSFRLRSRVWGRGALFPEGEVFVHAGVWEHPGGNCYGQSALFAIGSVRVSVNA